MIHIVLTVRFALMSLHARKQYFYNIKSILIHKSSLNTISSTYILLLINILLLCSGSAHPNHGWKRSES